ncbi:MAG: Imm52 family immunity protein [Pseudonocardiaceae bacterium]
MVKGLPEGFEASVPDPLFVGAYWGDRPEPPVACAERFLVMLDKLELVDPLLFGDWETVLSNGSGCPVERDSARVAEIFQESADPHDDSAVVGYLRSFLTGESDGWVGAGVTVNCGGARNYVVLDVSHPGHAERPWLDHARAIVATVVEAWGPDWAIFANHKLRKAQILRKDTPYVGAVTWFSDRFGAVSPGVDAGAILSRLHGGTLVDLMDRGELPKEERLLATVKTLDEAGFLTPMSMAHTKPEHSDS